MKKFTVTYKIEHKLRFGRGVVKTPHVKVVEADSYTEARHIVRGKQPKAMNIEIVEVVEG